MFRSQYGRGATGSDRPSHPRGEANKGEDGIRRIIPTMALALALTQTAHATDGVPLQTMTAETIVATWRCQDKIPVPRTHARSPWRHHSQGFRRAELNRWNNRLAHCRATLQERARQWNWQAWLPDKWARIGACETGYGQRPGNWRHNSGAYQGAFGFARSSWDAFKLPGYPDEAYEATPWQQYQVALAIYRRFGLSGWGCRNA